MAAFLRNEHLIRVCQIVIGAIFLVAGLAKLGDLSAFALQVHNFRLVPIPTENLVAMVLPWVEIVAGGALILGIERRAGAMLVAAMMIAFTIGVAQAMARGLDFECGCFGKGDASRVGFQKLFENLGMTAISILAALRPGNPSR